MTLWASGGSGRAGDCMALHRAILVGLNNEQNEGEFGNEKENYDGRYGCSLSEQFSSPATYSEFTM